MCQACQILQKSERSLETLWKYGSSLQFRQFNHHRTWRVTCLFGWKVPRTMKKVQEINSGNVWFSNVPFYAGWFPPPCLLFCSAKLLCHAQRDRIVSCYRQSCWHLLEFLFIRSSFLVFISLSNFCSCWDFLYLVSALTSNLRAGCGFSVKIAIFCILYMFSCNFLRQRQGITWLIAGSNSLLYQGLQIKPAVNMLRAL